MITNPKAGIRTCLFTGQELSTATRVEHTIPAKLGGRVRSREVSCDQFNNKSSAIDAELTSSFQQILVILAPLLSSEHTPGLMQVLTCSGEPALYLDAGAVPTSPGITVLKEPKTGRPIGASASDEDALLKLARKHGWTLGQSWHEPTTTAQAATVRSPLISREIDVAALKSTLLTWDELLRSESQPFTRSASVMPICSAIQKIVMHGEKAEELLRDVVWGVDYQAAALSQRLVNEHLAAFASPFQHILVATGNAAQRTLDLVWAILGFEAFRFRLSNHWDGGGVDFTYLFACGVLRNSHPSDVHRLHKPFSMGPRSAHCSWPMNNMSQGDMQTLLSNRTHYRRRAIAEATDLVEMTSDDMVRRGLHTMTSLFVADHERPGRVVDGLRLRFRQMFRGSLTGPKEMAAFNNVLHRTTQTIHPAMRNQTIARSDGAAQHIDWTEWVTIDRDVYRALKDAFGLPQTISAERVGVQKLTD